MEMSGHLSRFMTTWPLPSSTKHKTEASLVTYARGEAPAARAQIAQRCGFRLASTIGVCSTTCVSCADADGDVFCLTGEANK